MSNDYQDPAVQPIGASCGGRSASSCLPGNRSCTNTPWSCNVPSMHLHLVTDQSPAWIIGEDASSGEAWLVHNRPPRFVASVCHQNAVVGLDDVILLDCGLALTQLRWLGTGPGRSSQDVLRHAGEVLARWMDRQLARAGRAA
mgnify:CR=1 FL=1